MSKNYIRYLNFQSRRAKKTKKLTPKNEASRLFIYRRMQEFGISGKTVLCVGARHKSEPEFFEKRGYIADAIDLFENDKISVCDMSRIYKHPVFKYKRYDVVFSNSAMEHCLDLDGFIKSLNTVCEGYFLCMCDVPDKEDDWDCSIHPFMEQIADVEKTKSLLSDIFKEFDVVVNECQKRGRRLFFILKKRK